MLLDITVAEMDDDKVVRVTLSGELTREARDRWLQELETLAALKPRRVVFCMHDLTYITSEALRMFLATKQLKNMSGGVEVYMIAPQPRVLEIIEGTVPPKTFIIQDTYPGCRAKQA